MLKPNARHARRYWETLTDAELLAAELTTDDPERLANLVREVPGGDAEPYVEYKYDLRGSEREMLHCVHGNHPHLSGFVMRKGEYRFLVGRICGKTIYGEDFDAYTADFDAAVNRQDTLRRRREIEQATQPFLRWFSELLESPVFDQHAALRERFRQHMPWIFENLPRLAAMPTRGVNFPAALFAETTDPARDIRKIAGELNAAVLSFVARADQTVTIDPIRRHFEALLRRVEAVLDQLKEIEDFFQPAIAGALCTVANEYDNPKKRKYAAGLLSITCKRSRDEVVLKMPKSFKLPDRRPIDAFRAALGGLSQPAQKL